MTKPNTQITIPAVIAHNSDKVQAFEAGWRHCQKMENPSYDEVVAKLGIPEGEPFQVYQDTVRPCSELENVFWWGYFASTTSGKKAKSEKTKPETTADCNIGEAHQMYLDELHARMRRNPSFIPNWAWPGRDDELRC